MSVSTAPPMSHRSRCRDWGASRGRQTLSSPRARSCATCSRQRAFRRHPSAASWTGVRSGEHRRRRRSPATSSPSTRSAAPAVCARVHLHRRSSKCTPRHIAPTGFNNRRCRVYTSVLPANQFDPVCERSSGAPQSEWPELVVHVRGANEATLSCCPSTVWSPTGSGCGRIGPGCLPRTPAAGRRWSQRPRRRRCCRARS
jgi:hypothetical protein